jgi:general secretion pathway protein K
MTDRQMKGGPMTARDAQGGVVLVNVLVVLAIAGGLMLLLISSQEAALDRVARASDAAVAEQIAFGAEASVVDALRRDLDDAPDTDYLTEPWALSVIQDEVVLPTGRFSVAITDLQAKFDINQLVDGGVATLSFTSRLLTELGKPPETAKQIARILGAVGRIGRVDDLAAFGVAPETLAALAPYVTALPIDGTVNLNTVDPFLLQVMLQNRSLAAQLVSLRNGRGFLTLEALNSVGALRPQNSGLTSNVYLVDILAQVGTAEITMKTVLTRRVAQGVKAVDVLERRFIYGGPETAPK